MLPGRLSPGRRLYEGFTATARGVVKPRGSEPPQSTADEGRVNLSVSPMVKDKAWRGSMRRSLTRERKCPREQSPAAGSARRHRLVAPPVAKCESGPTQQ